MIATPREAETTIHREDTWHELLSPDPRAARVAGVRGHLGRTRDWPRAEEADRAVRFPKESMEALKGEGLWGLRVSSNTW